MSGLGRSWGRVDGLVSAHRWGLGNAWRDALAAKLDGLTRTQRWLLWGALACSAVLLHLTVWGPAWTLWRGAEQRHARLDAADRQMQAVAAEAQALRLGGSPRMSPEQAASAIRTLTQSLLGEGAKLTQSGTRLTVSLQAVPAAAFSRWLTQVRERMGSKPEALSLSRSAQADQWSGQVVLLLPEVQP
jgi:type II secretory pathway component PulM